MVQQGDPEEHGQGGELGDLAGDQGLAEMLGGAGAFEPHGGVIGPGSVLLYLAGSSAGRPGSPGQQADPEVRLPVRARPVIPKEALDPAQPPPSGGAGGACR